MKRMIRDLLIIAVLLTASFMLQAQQLDVTVTNVGSNTIRIMGTATGSGFASSPSNAWGDVNLTWRIPKTAAVPAPTPQPAPPTSPSATPEVTAESTGFTAVTLQDGFTNSTELAIFDVTTFGGPDDGYWYFQVTGTTSGVQNIATGTPVLLYEFILPTQWACPGCVELLTTEVPDLLTYGGISTQSFIQNVGINQDVLNIVSNSAPLPVSWLYIKAEPKDNKVIEVKWATAAEQNNAGFGVERSDDGGRSWRLIREVAGAGTSSTPKYYSVVDEQVVAGLRYYYRIRQKDLDGRVRYSTLAMATLTGGNYFTVAVKPNPVRDRLYLELQSSRKQTAQVVISDIAGKVYRVERGIRIEGAVARYSCEVAGYPGGTYVAKVIAEDGTVQSVKFVISR